LPPATPAAHRRPPFPQSREQAAGLAVQLADAKEGWQKARGRLESLEPEHAAVKQAAATTELDCQALRAKLADADGAAAASRRAAADASDRAAAAEAALAEAREALETRDREVHRLQGQLRRASQDHRMQARARWVGERCWG